MTKKRFPELDENLRRALTDLNKLKHKVAAPANVLEKAAYIYRKALEYHIVYRRNISTMIGACLYAACVDDSYPITIKNIANASNETEKNIVRYYQTLTYALSLKEMHLDAITSFDKTVLEPADALEFKMRTDLDPFYKRNHESRREKPGYSARYMEQSIKERAD